MPNYRRAFVPGGCWFFTVNLLDRRQTLLVDQIEFLRAAVAATRQSYAFTIDAFVVLPRSPARGLESACRRFRFLDALAADQEPLRKGIAEARSSQRSSHSA
jgi:hypothetical protein